MSRTLSVALPDDLGDAVDDDIANLSRQMGRELTRSQYLRILLNERLQRSAPFPVGVSEGMKLGVARFMHRMQDVVKEIVAEAEAEAEAATDG